MALDQTTGTTVWGPITIAGVLNAVFDNGMVFVCTGATIQAYDAQTGALKWSVTTSGGASFASLAAANGMVFASGENSTRTRWPFLRAMA